MALQDLNIMPSSRFGLPIEPEDSQYGESRVERERDSKTPILYKRDWSWDAVLVVTGLGAGVASPATSSTRI